MTLQDLINVLIASGANVAQIKQGLDLYESITNGADDAAPRSSTAGQREHARRETYVQDTAVCKASALADWVPFGTAAQHLGIAPDALARKMDGAALASMEWHMAPPLVYLPQVRHFCQTGRVQRVEPDKFFAGWDRQQAIADRLGVNAIRLFELADAGRVAVYKPHMRLVIMNEAEVRAMLRANGVID